MKIRIHVIKEKLRMSLFKIYDEDDNFIGEYVGEFVDNAKENVASSFDNSPGAGCMAILILAILKFPWLIIVIIAWLLLKLMWKAVKLALRIIWWLLRLCCISLWWIVRAPFMYVLYREMPDWWFPEW